jgi:hypothetical protein
VSFFAQLDLYSLKGGGQLSGHARLQYSLPAACHILESMRPVNTSILRFKADSFCLACAVADLSKRTIPDIGAQLDGAPPDTVGPDAEVVSGLTDRYGNLVINSEEDGEIVAERIEGVLSEVTECVRSPPARNMACVRTHRRNTG